VVVTTPDRPRERQYSLDVLRVCAVVGVVAIHVFGAIVSDPALRGNPGWWLAAVLDLGNIWVVPAFVMVSGALLLGGRAQSEGPGAFYRKRLLRLGPAFVFWQVFYIVVVRWLMSGQRQSVGGVIGLMLDGRTYTHLYFLWLIVGLYAVAPVLAAFLAQGGRRRAVVFAAIVLAATVAAFTASALLTHLGQPRPILLSAFTQWIPYVGYFLAGWALRGLAPRGWRLILAAAVAVVALAEVVVQYGVGDRAPLLQALLPVSYLGPVVAVATIAVFLSFAGVFAGLRPGRRGAALLRELSDASFGVFLVHFALLIALRMIPGFGPLTTQSFPAALAAWAIVVAASFALALVCRRIPVVRRVF
jgi:surface polysaccharide O-acyltransferase-like enzyme